MKRKSRSPLKDKPLRVPGQSLLEERDRLFDDRLLPPYLVAVVLVAFAAIEWVRHITGSPPNPILFTAIAVIAVAYSTYAFIRNFPKARALRLALEGEKAVRQFLERLRAEGYDVFHDVVGPSFNVDHVLIGPAGIFTIETKTRSKSAKGDDRVVCRGDELRVGTFEPDRNPIIQAKAQASWLRQILSESTGRIFAVRPVVLFPGWYVEQDAESRRHAWVLEPKALPAFLKNPRQPLSVEDIRLASFHLSRFIRGYARARG